MGRCERSGNICQECVSKHVESGKRQVVQREGIATIMKNRDVYPFCAEANNQYVSKESEEGDTLDAHAIVGLQIKILCYISNVTHHCPKNKAHCGSCFNGLNCDGTSQVQNPDCDVDRCEQCGKKLCEGCWWEDDSWCLGECNECDVKMAKSMGQWYGCTCTPGCRCWNPDDCSNKGKSEEESEEESEAS